VRTPGDSALTLLRLLDVAYPDPDPTATAEQFARAAHDDIAQLDDEQLYVERVQCGTRWAWTPPHRRTPWLVERRARLEREATRREQRQRQR
jgi:hypothetical protein